MSKMDLLLLEGILSVEEFRNSSLVSEFQMHGKFEHLWKGPYQIAEDHGNNSYSLQEVNCDSFSAGPVNGRFLKHYLTS